MGFFRKLIGSVGTVAKRIGSTSHNVLRRIGSVAHGIKDAASSFDDATFNIPSDFVKSLPFGSTALKAGGALVKGIDTASKYSKKAAEIGDHLEKYGQTGGIHPSISNAINKYR